MTNGDPQVSWQWLAGSLMVAWAAVAMAWTRFVSGKVNGHSERLAKVEQMCESQDTRHSELRESIGKLHMKVDRLIERQAS
jgi:hypothetical protein